MSNCMYQVDLAKPKPMSLRATISKGIKKYLLI